MNTRLRLLCCILMLGLCALLPQPVTAAGLVALDDVQLAEVQGGDGLGFNLVGFSLSGPLSMIYTAPDGASLRLANLYLARSDDLSATFSDPYRLDIVARGNGLAELVLLSGPANANGLLRWQFAADASVEVGGTRYEGGSLLISDLVSRNASLALTTPATPGVDGIAFGMGLQLDIGTLAIQPRGRSMDSEALSLSGIHLSAAQADGTRLASPWQIADASLQPGILNVVTDASGASSLHLGIAWPSAGSEAPLGSLLIDNISFRSASLPGQSLELGSSRIGTMQIQYLDIKLKGGL